MAKTKAAIKLSTAEKVAAENKYERAAAIWVAHRFSLNADKIYDVNFSNYVGGYCETCGYETLGVEFYLDGKYSERELGYYGLTPGQFIEEAVEIMQEMEG